MKKIALSLYAKLDPAHLYDGLFVPTGGRPRGRLYVPPRSFGGVKVSYQGYEQLGAGDQSVLLAIAAQAGMRRVIVPHGTESSVGAALRRRLYGDGDDDQSRLVAIATTLYALAKDAGYTAISGETIGLVRASLNRLGNAQIRIISRRLDTAANIIGSIVDPETGSVGVVINPRLTEAVLGGQHARISLTERRALRSEVAKLLHAWLSAYLRAGKSLVAEIDTLGPHVWGPAWHQGDPAVRSRRRGQLRDALNEIRGIGWQADADNTGSQISGSQVCITRPRNAPDEIVDYSDSDDSGREDTAAPITTPQNLLEEIGIKVKI